MKTLLFTFVTQSHTILISLQVIQDPVNILRYHSSQNQNKTNLSSHIKSENFEFPSENFTAFAT